MSIKSMWNNMYQYASIYFNMHKYISICILMMEFLKSIIHLLTYSLTYQVHEMLPHLKTFFNGKNQKKNEERWQSTHWIRLNIFILWKLWILKNTFFQNKHTYNTYVITFCKRLKNCQKDLKMSLEFFLWLTMDQHWKFICIFHSKALNSVDVIRFEGTEPKDWI